MIKNLIFIILVFAATRCCSQISPGALYFDGTDDYVNLPFPSGFYSVVGTFPFTIEAWIRADSPNPFSEDVIISSRNETGTSTQGFKLSIFDGYLSFWGPGAQTNVPVNIKDGLCHHVAVVRQGTVMTAYIDGVAYSNLVDPGDISSTEPVYIGKWYNQFGNFTAYFMGVIKEVRVWSFARTQAEIQNNMNAVVSSSDPDLVDYFRFNEGSGTIVNDYGNGGMGGNYADIYGNAVWTTACPGCTPPSAKITAGGPLTFCSGGSVTLNAPNGANRTYQWKKGANLVSGATLSSYTATTGGNYRVIVTNTLTFCSKTTASATVVTVNPLPAAIITPQGSTTFCAGESVVLQANSGTGLTYQWRKGNGNINGATLQNYTALTGGTYKVTVTNANSCSKLSAGTVVTVNCREGKTGLDQMNLEVYPNPSGGMVTLRFYSPINQLCETTVNDLMGRQFFNLSIPATEGVNERNIDLSNFDKGIYFVKLKSNSGEFVKRIIVQ